MVKTKQMLCCPLVVINVITVQTHLSGLICVRNSDPVGGVWNVIVWLILVDVLNLQRTHGTEAYSCTNLNSFLGFANSNFKQKQLNSVFVKPRNTFLNY